MLRVELKTTNLSGIRRLDYIEIQRVYPRGAMRAGEGRGDYLVTAKGKRARILAFDRSRGGWALVAEALDALGHTA